MHKDGVEGFTGMEQKDTQGWSRRIHRDGAEGCTRMVQKGDGVEGCTRMVQKDA